MMTHSYVMRGLIVNLTDCTLSDPAICQGVAEG